MAESTGEAAVDGSDRNRAGPPAGPPPASDVFLQYVTGQVNKGDVYQMVGAQQHM